jgi:hypothetical protein
MLFLRVYRFCIVIEILMHEAGDILTAVAVKLSVPDPYDLTDIDFSEYKGIVAPWNNWRAVQAQCTALAAALMLVRRYIH